MTSTDRLATLLAVGVAASWEIVLMGVHLEQALKGGSPIIHRTPLGIVVVSFIAGLMYTVPCVIAGRSLWGPRGVIPGAAISCLLMTLTAPTF